MRGGGDVGRMIEGSNRPQVVCIGETMLMFAPSPPESIEYSLQFTAFNGGAESNVAIGLERLGIHAGWIGKLPRNALGRKIVNEIRSFGVDTSAVIWSETGRVGIFFVEWGAAPRPLRTIYDRANTAASTMRAEEIDWDYVARAEWIHLTGITPALSPTCRECVHQTARRARELGVKVCFDVNYRSLLWSQEQACASYRQILPHVNLLVATEDDLRMLGGHLRERRDILQGLAGEYALDAIVMTLGSEGSLGYSEGQFASSSGYQVDTVNRLGAGDAFVAGLLYGYTRSGLQEGLDYGGAMAALKMTVPQNIPIIDLDDVERLLAGKNADIVR